MCEDSETGMETLREIAGRYDTDKARPQRLLLTAYERLLEPRRTEKLRLVEIGVLGGGSLRMWRDYLPNAEITGADLDPVTVEGFTVLHGDQGDPEFLAQLAEHGPFDVVIDDGSHRTAHQLTTLEHLWPHLNPGGIYFVEDIHVSYFRRYHGGYRAPGTFVEYAKTLLDDPNARWHQQGSTLAELESVQMYPELVVLTKLREPFYGGRPPDPERLAFWNEEP